MSAARLRELDDLATDRRVTIGVAESLTCGKLTLALGASERAGEWLRGGIIAYSNEVKFDLLGIPRGPVYSIECATQLAHSAARLLGAQVAIGVTGVGGPEPMEGQPAGSVFLAVSVRGAVSARAHQFSGSPEKILESTVDSAIELAIESIRELAW